MKRSKKFAVVAGTTAVLVAGAGAAYAVFSGGAGSGDGSATTTSTTPKNLSTDAQLHSGTIPLDGSDAPIDIKVINGHPYSLSWLSDSIGITSLPAGCPTGSYLITGTSAVGGSVGPNTDTGWVASGFSIHFVDSSSVNQDTCLTGNVSLTSGVS